MRVAIVFFFLLTSGSLFAQAVEPPFDFQPYPERHFRYESMRLHLNVDPAKTTIEGEVTYIMSPILAAKSSLTMLAFRTDVKEVLLGKQKTTFSVQDDTIRIGFPNEVKPGEKIEVSILFATEYDFGVFKDQDNLVWSSFMPYAQAHFFPGHAHPRTEVQSEIHLWIPPHLDGVASGLRIADKVEKDLRHLVFTSSKPVALSEIGFAVGSFHTKEVRYGSKVLKVYVDKKAMSAEQANEQLSFLQEVIQKTERRLSTEFPYTSMALVVLPSGRSEHKNAGAGILFSYINETPMKYQIAKGVFHQWFGSYQRTETWRDATADMAWSAWLFHALYPDVLNPLEAKEDWDFSHYGVHSVKHLLQWSTFLKGEGKALNEAMNKSVEEVLQSSQRVWQWHDYARIWYKYTGKRWSYPSFPEPFKRIQREVWLEIGLNELNYTFTIQLRSQDPVMKAYKEALTWEFEVETDAGMSKLTVHVPVSDKKQVFELPATALNVHLQTDIDSLDVYIQKPAAFWFHQLRKGATREDKLQAATALAETSGDTDMQLALRDMLKSETDAEIKAALLITLAGLTKGATGTEQMYMETAFSTEWVLQRASLIGLRNFEGNEQAINSAMRLFRRVQEGKAKEEALTTLKLIMPKEEFVKFAQTFVETDTTYIITSAVLSAIDDVGAKEVSRQLALRFTDSRYPQHVYTASVKQMLQQPVKTGDWSKRYLELLRDNDPYIRYIAVGAGPSILDKDTAFTILHERLLDEFDYRVRTKLLSELDKISTGLSGNK